MNSKYLIENGFIKFGSFDTDFIKSRQKELDCSGIYVFVLNETFPRLNGKTDILYIGQAGQRKGRPIIKRMLDYCKAYDSTPQDKRICDTLNKIKTKIRIGRMLKNEKIDNKVNIYFKIVEPFGKCKEIESDLLEQYYIDHLELPPLNRSH